jgi:hypothetical protein
MGLDLSIELRFRRTGMMLRFATCLVAAVTFAAVASLLAALP